MRTSMVARAARNLGRLEEILVNAMSLSRGPTENLGLLGMLR